MHIFPDTSFIPKHCCNHHRSGPVVGKQLIIQEKYYDLKAYEEMNATSHDIHTITSGVIDGTVRYVIAGQTGILITATEEDIKNNKYEYVKSLKDQNGNNDDDFKQHLYGSTFNGKYFVIVGNNATIVWTNDCKHWKRTIGNTNTESQLYGVCYDSFRDRFIAVGYDYKIAVFRINNNEITSYYQKQDVKPEDTINAKMFRYVIHDTINDLYVLVGEGGDIRYTNAKLSDMDPDLVNYKKWSPVAPTVNMHPNGTSMGFESIVYNYKRNEYVVVGNDGLIIYTNDIKSPTSWKLGNNSIYNNEDKIKTKEENGTLVQLQGVNYDYNHDIYIAVGWNTTILYTDDLSKPWRRHSVFNTGENKYQYVSINPNGNIIVAGGNRMFIIEDVIDIKRPFHLTEKVLNRFFPIGFQFKKTNQCNPSDMYYFGVWSEEYDSDTKIFTYTRIK